MSTDKTIATTFVQPYRIFGGRCEEALDFYRSAVGAKVGIVMRFKDAPDPPPPGMLAPGFEAKIMHAEFQVGEATILASDGGSEGATFAGFSLALSLPTEADVDRVFAALVDGGQTTMPPGKTFWSPRFGMLTDRFGVAWMVMVPGEEPS